LLSGVGFEEGILLGIGVICMNVGEGKCKNDGLLLDNNVVG